MSLTYGGVEPQPALAWQFENSNVDSVTGLTPSAQVSPGPAQLVGGASLVTNAPSGSNTAVSFNGTTGYMNLGAGSPAAIDAKTSNIFVECWVYQVNSATPFYQGLIGTSADSQQWVVQLNGGTPGLWISGPVSTTFTSSIPLSTWTHISFSWALGPTSNTAYFYINGASAGSVTSTTPVSGTPGNAVIGNVNSGILNGYIRDLRVFQGGVVPTGNFTPVEAPFSMNVFPTYMTGGTIAITLLGQFITYVPGKYNTGLRIANKPGTTPANYLRYLTTLNSTTGFAVSWWFKLDSYLTGQNQNPIVLSGGGYGNLVILVSGTTSVYWVVTTGCTVTVYKSQSFAANQWINLCLTYVGTTMVLYRDGVSFATGYTSLTPTNFVTDGLTPSTITVTVPTAATLTVGLTAIITASGGTFTGALAGTYVITAVASGQFTYVASNQVTITVQPTSKSVQINNYVAFNVALTTINVGGTNSDAMNGVVDDIRVYNTALTAAQVRSVYSSQGAPAPSRAMPLPKLAWDFESSNVDYVSGLAPVFTSTNTSTTFAPTYQAGKYNLGMRLVNTTGANTWSRYNFTNSITADTGITLACWVNYTTLSASSTAAVTLYDSNIPSYGNTISIGLTTTSSLGYTSGAATYSSILTPNSIPGSYVAGKWYHLAVTFTSSSIIGYVNGVASTPKTTSTTGLSFSGLRIGTFVNNFNNNAGVAQADCTIDDLRIFDRALTSAQVQSIYNQQGMPGRGVQVKTAPAYTVSDGSPSPLTLSTYGSATSNTNSPFGGTEGSIENLNYSIPSSVSKTNFSFWGSNCFIEFWMYLSGTNSGNPRIIERGNYPNSEYSVYMNASSGGYYLKFSYGANFPFAFQFVPGTWNHFSFSYNYATQTSYGSINGSVASGGTTAGITYNPGSSVRLYPSGGGYVIDISNLRVVTGATTLPYISNFTVPTAPLSVYPTGTTALLLRSVSPGIRLTGTPLFSQLSSAATASAVGAFSLRAVNGTSVKAVQVRNGTTSAVQDFYADRLGNLLTAPVVGQSLANWLGGATGYVTTWYDQSGKGNHASQATAANQPIIQKATKGPGYSTLWPGLTSTRLIYGTSSNIFDSTNYSVCVAAKRTVAVSTTTYYAGTNGQTVQYQNLGIGYISDTALRHTHYSYSNNGPSGLPAYAGASEPIAYDYFAFSQTALSGFREYSWRSETKYTSGNNGLTTPLTRSGNSTIGGTNDSASFTGEIYELLVFTQSLYDLDTSGGLITQLYNNQLGAYGV